MAASSRVSLETFLAMEETKPYPELVDGEVVPKPMPTQVHGRLVMRLGARLLNYLDSTGEGAVETEVRHVDRDEERVYLPDLSVHLGHEPSVAAGPVERPPAIAAEVVSPDDRWGRVAERVAFYLRTGTQLVWIVDPGEQQVVVYRPRSEPELRTRAQMLDARPVLADFTLSIDDLFRDAGVDTGGEPDA